MIVFYQGYNDVVISKLAFGKHFLDVQIHQSQNIKFPLTFCPNDTHHFVNSLDEVIHILSSTPSYLCQKILYLNFKAFPDFRNLSQKLQQNWYTCHTNNSYNFEISFFLTSITQSTINNLSTRQSTNHEVLVQNHQDISLFKSSDITKPKNEMAYLASMHKPRAFNSITLNSQTVLKKSHDIAKMKAEQNWYSKAEKWYPLHIPKMVSGAEGSYEIERIHGFPLSQIYFSGSQDFTFWQSMITNLIDIFYQSLLPVEAEAISKINTHIIDKNNDRIASYHNELKQLTLQPISINGEEYDFDHEVDKLNYTIMNTTPCRGFVHGDPCLSNIMYNPISENWYFIDPRGYFGDDHSSVFDSHYDLAKLHHSMFGCYEAITSGNYDLQKTWNGYNFSSTSNAFATELEQVFDNKAISAGYDIARVKAISKSFFLSMIPLHYESRDRQLALLLNGLELRL